MKSDHLILTSRPFHPILVAAAFNFFLLILMFVIYCSSLAKPAGYEILIPRLIEGESLRKDQTIRITAENVFYFNDRVVTLSELKKELIKIDFSRRSIFIRVDRRSQMGRVMDVWDLARAMGNAQVHIVTDQRN